MNTADFETDAGRAAKVSEKRAKEMAAAFDKAGIAIGLAFGAVLGTVSKTVKDGIDHMDDLSKAAQKVGLPTEQFSQLAYAGDLADVSMETLVSSLGKLTKAQAAALKDTSEQAKVFDALGISAKDADGNLRKAGDVLGDFADRFQALEGSPEAMAAGFSLFGRSFQELIPLLKDGSSGLREAAAEADALGKTVSTEAGQAAEQFNDDLTRLQGVLQGVALNVAADLLPSLTDLSGKFVDNATEGRKVKEVADGIAESLRLVGTTAHTVSSAFEIVGTGLATLVGQGHAAIKALMGDFQGAAALYKAASQGFDAEIDEAFGLGDSKSAGGKPAIKIIEGADLLAQDRMELAAAKEAQARAERLRKALGLDAGTPAAKRSGGGRASARTRELPDFQREDADLLRREIEETARAQEAFAGLTATLSGPLAEAEHDHIQRLKEITDTGKLAGLSSAEIASVKELEVRRYKEEADAIQERLEPGKQLLKDLEFELGLIGKTNAERDAAIQMRGWDAESIQAYADQVVAANQRIQDSSELMSERVQAADGLRDAFGGFLDDLREGEGLVDALENAFGRLADTLFDMASKKLIEQIFGSYGTTGQGSSGAGWLSALLNSTGSSQGSIADLFASDSFGYFAKGGYTGDGPKHEPAGIVHRGEYVIPAEVVSSIRHGRHRTSSSGDFAQTLNIQVQGTMNRRTQERVAQLSGREAARAMARTGR